MSSTCKESKAITYTQEELIQACKLWQKRLRLQDWKVDVKLVHTKDIDGNTGICEPTRARKYAQIKIATAESTTDSLDDYDMLLILVHELLHLHFDEVDPAVMDDKGELTADYMKFDSGIELIAEALVKLYRDVLMYQRMSKNE